MTAGTIPAPAPKDPDNDSDKRPSMGDMGYAQDATEPDALMSHGLYRLGLAYGKAVYRARWLIIVLWVIGLGVSLPFAGSLSKVLSGGGFTFQQSESVHVGNVLVAQLGMPPSQAIVVFQSPNTVVSDPAYQAELSAFTQRAQAFPNVSRVSSGGVGQDGRTTFLVLAFTRDYNYMQQQMPALRQQLPSGARGGPAHAYLTGDAAVYDEFTSITQADATRAEEVALPLALVVLIIVFGTLVAAAAPVTLALVAVPIALGILYAVAVHTQTSIFVLNVASLIGLGISIDYSLFMTRRFRDELAQGRTVHDAVGWTVATAGEAILFSGLTVIIGFVGLVLIGVPFMTSIGTGGAVVVGVAVLAALTLLPALLSIVGTRINALRVLPRLGRTASVDGEQHGFWHGLAVVVMRRPVLFIVGVSIFLLALGWPALALSVGTPGSASLPASSSARQGLDTLSQQFPETNSHPVYIIAQTRDGSPILNSQNVGRVYNLTQWLTGRTHVTGVQGIDALPPELGASALTRDQYQQLYATGAYATNPQLAPVAQLVKATTRGDLTLITVKTDTALDSAAGKGLIDDLRAHAHIEGLTTQVGGFQAVSLDFTRYLYGNFPRAIAFILLATYVLLLLMFRSAVLPLKAIVMNVLSVGAAYGALVYVFQWGNLANLLQFKSSGFIDSTLPILLFCILFGLSMDYEVFLLSRIREEWLRTGDNRLAVAYGIEKTGGVITNAALLFVIVCGAFAFTSILTTKEIGLGLAVAIIVDAAIIRTLLVPAMMRLLGRWNWWLPGRPLPRSA
jgi:putative drug exporter of the RND superfamily